MWLFLLAARHRMQVLSALACGVGSGLKYCASLEFYLFIHLYCFCITEIISYKNRGLPSATHDFCVYVFLSEHYKHCAIGNGVAFCYLYCNDFAVAVGVDVVLHLHGLKHHHGLAFGNYVANIYLYINDYTR